MESEMASILVHGVGPEQKKVVFFKNHDFVNRKFNTPCRELRITIINWIVQRWNAVGRSPVKHMISGLGTFSDFFLKAQFVFITEISCFEVWDFSIKRH